MSGLAARCAHASVLLLFVALPLGTTPVEIANGVGLIVVALSWLAGVRPTGSPRDGSTLAAPAALLALGWMSLALAPGGSIAESAGRVWALSTVWIAPQLVRLADRDASHSNRRSWIEAAMLTAVPVSVLALAQGAVGVGGVLPGGLGFQARGLYSHHLTLAYVWLPLVCVAWAKGRWTAAGLLGGAVAFTGSTGALAGLGVAALAYEAHRLWGRRAALAAGLVGAVAAIAALPWAATPQSLRERAILWTGGAQVALDGGVPPGTWRSRIAPIHHHLASDFDFPHHAHDTALQVAADSGPAAWLALAWGGWFAARDAPPWLLAALMGLAVGSLTQDLIGDLEVLRGLSLVLAVGLAETARRGRDHPG